MPSDPRTAGVLTALEKPRERFRSAVAATLEEVRVHLDRQRSEAGDRLAVLAAELGPVGTRHIDVGRLAEVLGATPDVEPAVQDVMGRALEVLETIAARGNDAFLLELTAGENVYERAAGHLADLGRAMGAARAVDLARGGRYRPAEHGRWLERFPFGLWSQTERTLAPPLVIELEGADLRPAGLAEFLDGTQKIVLVVRGQTSPAPLVRLVAPRTFVAQDGDAAVVARLAGWEGPGIVALMPEGAASFVHDPALGPALDARLSVAGIPELDHRRRTGPFTTAQQKEEVEQLRSLQAAAAATSATPATAAPLGSHPVDKLASWLLQQADLSGV
jgi:hypothetical protein